MIIHNRAVSGRSGPKYLMIANTLETEIRALKYPSGSRIGTEAEIQQRFGVSSITAKHALGRLRDRGLIVRRRRLGSFVADRPFHPEISPKSRHQVGLIWEAAPSTQAGIEMLCTIENDLARAGYGLMFRASAEDPAREKECLEWFAAHDIQRVILTPAGDRHTAAVYDAYRARGMRLVFIDRGVDSPHFPLVGFDDVEIGRLGVLELKQAGCRKIAVLATSRSDTSIDDRLRGAVEEGRRLNLPVQIYPIDMAAYNEWNAQPLRRLDWWRETYAATGSGNGWFGLSGGIAAGLLRVMLHTKTRVPADGAVVGVGTAALDPLAAQFLSGVELPFKQLGQAAARCAISDPACGLRLPPAGIVRRASTTAGAEVRWDEGQATEQFHSRDELVAAA